MPTEIKIPSLGESITGGIIAAWHVENGAFVKKDQIIYELETDKITSEGLAEASGTIELKAAEGDEVEIGQIVAMIDDSADEPEAARESVADDTNPKDDAPPSVDSEPATTAKEPEKSAKQSRSIEKPAPSSQPAKSEGRITRKRMSPLRQKISERLVNVQQETAMLTTFNEVDLSSIKALRADYQEAFQEKYGIKLGFMSFFVKAVVRALQQNTAINAFVDGSEIVENHYYDIGIAVSTEKGLTVPVVRNCDELGLADIEKEIKAYADKARSGKIALEDLQGGVFTITNGGVFGSMLSTPILNPPQSAILGMHTIQDRPVAIEGNVEIRPMMYLALSYDHRIVDGREAVNFLIRVKEALENPIRLLLEV